MLGLVVILSVLGGYVSLICADQVLAVSKVDECTNSRGCLVVETERESVPCAVNAGKTLVPGFLAPRLGSPNERHTSDGHPISRRRRRILELR
jgi:hypothetical protein